MIDIGRLDQPTSGIYRLDDQEVSHMRGNQLAEIRNRKLSNLPMNRFLRISLKAHRLTTSLAAWGVRCGAQVPLSQHQLQRHPQ